MPNPLTRLVAEALLVVGLLLPLIQLDLSASYRATHALSAMLLAGAAGLSLRSYRTRASLFDLAVGVAALCGVAMHLAVMLGGGWPW